MNKRLVLTTLATAIAVVMPSALASQAATVLFTQEGTKIVGVDGRTRAAHQGDVLEFGERMVTPPNAITQLLLTDGSLIGMRPASEVKIDLPAGMLGAIPSTGNVPQTISLVQGAVRLIGSELMDNQKPSALTLQTGQATVTLRAADLESAIVRTDAPKTSGSNEAGSYSRLQTGTGSIQSGAAQESLTPRQVSFVSTTKAAPILVASVPAALFASVVVADPIANLTGARTATPATTLEQSTPATSKIAPAATSLLSPVSTLDTKDSAVVKLVAPPSLTGAAVTPSLAGLAMAVSPTPATTAVIPSIGLISMPTISASPASGAASALTPPAITTAMASPSLTIAPALVSSAVTPTITVPAVTVPTTFAPAVVVAALPTASVLTAPVITTPVAITPVVTTPVIATPVIIAPVITAVAPPITVIKAPTVTFIPTVTQPKVTCTPQLIAGVKRCI